MDLIARRLGDLVTEEHKANVQTNTKRIQKDRHTLGTDGRTGERTNEMSTKNSAKTHAAGVRTDLAHCPPAVSGPAAWPAAAPSEAAARRTAGRRRPAEYGQHTDK